MPIPVGPTFTNDSSANLDLSTTAGVNSAIASIKAQMIAQGWTQTAGLYATCNVGLGLPLVGTRTSGFSLVFNSYFGWRVRFFDSSLGEIGGILFPDYYVDSHGGTQVQMAGYLAASMFAINGNYNVAVVIDGGGNPSILTITAVAPGPSWNDQGPIAGNILTGTQANAIPKGGGWQMTSAPANGNSAVVAALTNTFLNTLTINASINGHAIAQKYIENRTNYLSVVDPYQWVLFHLNDGTVYNNGTIYTQYHDYWLCAPNVALAQRTAAVSPLTYCAFEMITIDRGQLNTAAVVATALNTSFQDGGFGSFPNVDQGFSMIPLNSMQTAAGALTTTADKVIETQALVALAPGTGSPMVLVGDVWDMFLTTKYYAQDTRAIGPGGRNVIAYRSQQAPCEATLWLALN